MNRHRAIVVGDQVAYSVQWLQSTGMSHTDAAHARGVVKQLQPFGRVMLATVEWDCDMPAYVIALNLALVGLNSAFSSV